MPLPRQAPSLVLVEERREPVNQLLTPRELRRNVLIPISLYIR